MTVAILKEGVGNTDARILQRNSRFRAQKLRKGRREGGGKPRRKDPNF